MARLTVNQRKQLAAERNSGTGYRTLSKKYGCNKATIKRWAAEGLKAHPNWQDAPRCGRPSTLSKAQRRKARAAALRGHTAPHIAGSLSKQGPKQVKPATVRRVLTSSTSPMQWAPKNRGRQLSDVNKGKRLAFCLKVKPRSFKSCLFADSKLLYIYEDGTGSTKMQWFSPTARPKRVRAGNPYVFHVYACVGKGCKSDLIFTAPSPPVGSALRKGTETFASRHFIGVAQQLHKTIKGWGKDSRYHRVVLDHAKQHTSKASKAALQAMGMYLLEDFPPQSWDLNIIENCWGVLDTKLAGIRGRGAKSGRGWRSRLQKAWGSIEQPTIDKLVSSLDQRIEDIKELGGAWRIPKAG